MSLFPFHFLKDSFIEINLQLTVLYFQPLKKFCPTSFWSLSFQMRNPLSFIGVLLWIIMAFFSGHFQYFFFVFSFQVLVWCLSWIFFSSNLSCLDSSTSWIYKAFVFACPLGGLQPLFLQIFFYPILLSSLGPNDRNIR